MMTSHDKMINCPICGHSTANDAPTCSNCHTPEPGRQALEKIQRENQSALINHQYRVYQLGKLWALIRAHPLLTLFAVIVFTWAAFAWLRRHGLLN